MNAPTFPQREQSAPLVRTEALKVFVRGLRIEAEVGVHDHEHGRLQPLIIDVELDVDAADCLHIADTVNYETIVAQARALAAAGHLKLVETFTERLAHGLLDDPRVRRARVRVEKPQALQPHAAAAGVEVTAVRAPTHLSQREREGPDA